MSGIYIDGVSQQGYARAGLSPTAEDAESVIPQLTAAVTTLVGAPTEPFETDAEAADAAEDAADVVQAIAGGSPVDDSLTGVLEDVNDAIELLNDGLNGSDLEDAAAKLGAAVAGLDGLFPDVASFPPPYDNMTSGLQFALSGSATELDDAILDGTTPPVQATVAYVRTRIDVLTDAIDSLRTGINSISPNPVAPLDPLTADIDDLRLAIIVALTPP